MLQRPLPQHGDPGVPSAHEGGGQFEKRTSIAEQLFSVLQQSAATSDATATKQGKLRERYILFKKDEVRAL
jgi:hypothetical protein